MIRIVRSSSGQQRLRVAETFARGFPPDAEIVLVAASRDAVDDLALRIANVDGALFGFHRFSLMQLVSHLAAAELAEMGRAPTTLLASEAVARRAAHEARRQGRLARLAPVSSFPGFSRALASTLHDLRLAGLAGPGPDAPEALSNAVGEVAGLQRLFDAELDDAALADRSLLLELARRGLARPEHAGLRERPLLLLDVGIDSVRQREFVLALCEGPDREVLVTVPAGDEATVDALGTLADVTDVHPEENGSAGSPTLSRLREHLFAETAPPRGEVGEELRIFSAPGEGRECVEIARRVLEETTRGLRFDEMAVFLRAPEAYSPLLETAFRRAGIPAAFARGTRRPDPSGRAFLALLACGAEGLSARRFAEYLSFGQVPDLDSRGAPPLDREIWAGSRDEALGSAAVATGAQLSLPFASEDAGERPQPAGTLHAPWKWEELLVEAAVIGGKDRWRRRLSGLERELRVQLEELASDDPESPRLPRLERELANLGHLERFAFPIVETLDGYPREAPWGQWLELLSRLAPAVLGRPERVLGLLAEMQPMAEVGPVTLHEVWEVLAAPLATLEKEPPPHRYGRVFVGTPDQARGRCFRSVFVPGLAERVFPQRPREDPLLLDAARARLSPDLATQEDRAGQERLLLRLAVGAATERVSLSYSRLDAVEARPRVPSFYGLDVVRATRGTLPNPEQLEREAADEARSRLAWPAPPDPQDAIDAVEHDLAVLGRLLYEARPEDAEGRARYLLELSEPLARSLRARWLRWRSTWVPQDGLVAADASTAPALAPHRLRERPYSVTSLQNYAVRPYRFLLSAILRLEPRAESAPLVQLDPLTRGRMFHEIQAQALRALQAQGALPLRSTELAAAEDLLVETVDRVAARYEEDLAPAIDRVWQDEVATMRADLRVWLRRLSEESAEWEPRHFEFTFGLPHLDTDSDPGSIPEPVVLEKGWRLRGAVDMVERNLTDGTLRVTDHKTGANRTTEGWVVGGGETLQPVLYGLAMERALSAVVREGRLSFCTARGGFGERLFPLDERARLYGNMVLEIIDRAVEGGALPPAPRRGACAYCDFRAVCGPHEEIRAARKKPDLIQDLLALRELP